jgi:hypothetical protein
VLLDGIILLPALKREEGSLRNPKRKQLEYDIELKGAGNVGDGDLQVEGYPIPMIANIMYLVHLSSEFLLVSLRCDSLKKCGSCYRCCHRGKCRGYSKCPVEEGITSQFGCS